MAKPSKTRHRFFEALESEEVDRVLSPPSYQIVTYPADFTLEVLVEKWKTGDVEVPPFQRRFVWTQAQASKLIESFLLGLPVPPIYLYAMQNNKFLVVDGQQRLTSIAYFFDGYWQEAPRGRKGGTKSVFKLEGLHSKSQFAEKTISDLERDDEDSWRKLKDSVLRSFVIRQLDPKDDTSIFYIFERLNTGAVRLQSQEIRTCIFNGTLNDLLIKLNRNEQWRAILGRHRQDKRRRDVELILRFLALYYGSERYAKPMTAFLNAFMAASKNAPKKDLAEYRTIFLDTMAAIHKHIGPKTFRISAGVNAAIYDAVSVAFARHLNSIPTDVAKRYKRLLKNAKFVDHVTYRTTDDEVVKSRLKLAERTLFG
jgi:hypothetical protein